MGENLNKHFKITIANLFCKCDTSPTPLVEVLWVAFSPRKLLLTGWFHPDSDVMFEQVIFVISSFCHVICWLDICE